MDADIQGLLRCVLTNPEDRGLTLRLYHLLRASGRVEEFSSALSRLPFCKVAVSDTGKRHALQLSDERRTGFSYCGGLSQLRIRRIGLSAELDCLKCRSSVAFKLASGQALPCNARVLAGQLSSEFCERFQVAEARAEGRRVLRAGVLAY